MSESPQNAAQAAPQANAEETARQQKLERREARRWWIKLFLQPILALAVGAVLIAGLGVAQRLGYISAGAGGGKAGASGGATTRYICPMMCTPPQSEPGRCPVCAMELVPAAAGGGGPSRSIEIAPADRRIANIQTVAVQTSFTTHRIRAIGELSYDESTLKTLAAYVDGRLDQMHAAYTGVVVEKGKPLALVYSPKLYSGQVEYLLAKKAVKDGANSTLKLVAESNRELLEGSRQRLIELGMTEEQIDKLEQADKANSRLELLAPISGTVIEKLAAEGQYVKEGQAIYRLADLSTVWLMLELFPEDAASIRDGQEITAEVQSLPGEKFLGRVAFIAPNVNPKTRTVGVRVAIANEDGRLRVGDYARATIDLPLADSVAGETLTVPRNAVLMAGDNSVVYVETESGRFEIRSVVLGPSSGDQIVIREGVKAGEQVAVRGNFLIDSQMQLAGNPSLIDPTKAVPASPALEPLSPQAIAALAQLPDADRQLAESQRICPVADFQLGAMGKPIKVDVNGEPVFICCEGCRESLLGEPEKYLAKLPRFEAGEHSRKTIDHLPLIAPPEDLETGEGLPPILIEEPNDE